MKFLSLDSKDKKNNFFSSEWALDITNVLLEFKIVVQEKLADSDRESYRREYIGVPYKRGKGGGGGTIKSLESLEMTFR